MIDQFAENLTASIFKIDLFRSDQLLRLKPVDPFPDPDIEDLVEKKLVDLEKSESVSSLSRWLAVSERQIRSSQLSLESLESGKLPKVPIFYFCFAELL